VPVKLRTAKAPADGCDSVTHAGGRGPRAISAPVFAPEVIALFVELERMPRQSPQFEERSRALAERLGLMDEWWTRQ
jgi:hypothetical protein